MSKITEIIRKYSSGELTSEEANKELKKEGASFHIDPKRCLLSAEQIAQGWGLLDTGTGSLDIAQMKDNELVNVDCGDMYAIFTQNGVSYKVNGKKLTKIKD